MTNLPKILLLDQNGTPNKFIDYERSAYYSCKGLIAWELGKYEVVLRGGTNKKGEQSKLVLSTIIAVKGKVNGKQQERMKKVPLTNDTLFTRDSHICAYCGKSFNHSKLSRDHILPRSKGGLDIWTNVVTSCIKCNVSKNDRTPEEWGKELLYVPYTPTKSEFLILANRNILADQMEFLMNDVPKYSRLRQ